MVKKSQGRKKRLGAAAAAVVATGAIAYALVADPVPETDGFDALALSADIDLTDYARTSTANVSSGPDVITVTLDFTSTNDLIDVSATYVSPDAETERGCTAYAPTTGTRQAGSWDCIINLEQNDDGGTWVLSHISARDTASVKLKYSMQDIIDAADVNCNGGAACDAANDFETVVTSSSEDITPPTVTSAVSSPIDLQQLFGGAISCNVSTTGGAVEGGCHAVNVDALQTGMKSFAMQGCTDLVADDDDFACDMRVPPGQAAGNYTITGFARDAVGNRGVLADADTYQLDTGGLEYTHCTTTNTPGTPIGGHPLAIEVDWDGDAWMTGEFSDALQYIDATDVSCAADMILVPSNATYPPYWYTSDYDTRSAFQESVKVDPVREVVWFSQGGATVDLTHYNHSRVIEYTPGSPDKASGGSFRVFNIPGIRNEVQGLYIDQARGWIWATESGQGKDFDGTPIATGSVIAFDWSEVCTAYPDVCDDQFEWEWGTCTGGGDAGSPCHVATQGADCISAVCTEINAGGTQLATAVCTGGEDPTVDGCIKRWILPAFNSATSHIVGDADGRIYYTNFWGSSLGRLDPVTGATVTYPLKATRALTFPGSFVGAGPWELDLTSDGLYLAWGEYFDNSYSRFPVNRSGDAECQELTPGVLPELLAWYTFDDADGCTGGIDDISGKGNAGTCQGDPTWTGADGKPAADGALVLDGTGDYVDIGTESLFDFPDSFSVAMWVKPSTQSGTYNALVAKGNSASFQVMRNNATTGTTFRTWVGGSESATAATPNIYDGAWHHVVAIHLKGWGKMLYIDGALVASANGHAGSITPNDFALRVGGDSQGSSLGDFTGSVDDIRVYGRVLRPDEVATLYQGNTIGLGGRNVCVNRIELEMSAAEMDEFKTHSIKYDGQESFWFTQDAKTRGPAIVHTGIGLIDPDWSHALVTDSADFSPDYNTTSKVFAGITVDPNTGEIWVAEFDPVGVGRFVPLPITSAIAVERHTVALGTGVTVATVDLSGTGFPTSNAVPFATTRVTALPTPVNAFDNIAVDVYFSGSDLIVSRAVGGGNLVVEVSLVAFNPGRIRVQSGTWSMSNKTTIATTQLPQSVDTSKAFPVFYGSQNSSSHGWNHFNLRPLLNSTAFRVERGYAQAGQTGTYSGHWFVAEALNDEWSVVPITKSIPTGTGVWLPPGDFPSGLPSNRSFLLGSLMGPSTSDSDSAKFTVDFQLSDSGGSIVALPYFRYNGAGGTLQWQGYIVTLRDGQGTVQRGLASDFATSTSIALGTQVDTVATDTIINVPGSMHVNMGAEEGTLDADVPAAFRAFDIVDGTPDNIRIQKQASTNNFNQTHYEVITWALP